MDLVAMGTKERQREVRMTVLCRPGGQWHDFEVSKLANGLMTEISQCPEKPEYLVLFNHYTKEQTLDALGGGLAYTAIQVTGVDSDDLPFRPGFI